MLKRRKIPWPAELGADLPVDRARTVARGYRALLAKWVRALDVDELDALTAAQAVKQMRAELDALDAMSVRFGEDHWLMPCLDGVDPGSRLTRAQVAQRARVDPDTVTTWGNRGLGGVRLLRGPDGRYDPDEVDRFLEHRITTSTPTPPASNPRGDT